MTYKPMRLLLGLWLVGVLACVFGCKSAQNASSAPGGHSGSANASIEDNRTNAASAEQPVLLAHLQAEIYEVTGVDPALSLSSKELVRRAGTADRFLKELRAFGSAHTLYRFDQRVNVYDQTLSILSREPIVENSRRDSRGGQINTVRFQEVGAILKLTGHTPSLGKRRKAPDVSVSVELATSADSGIELVPGQRARSMRSFTLAERSELRMGRPGVILATTSASGPATVYLVRYAFSE